MNRCTVCAPTTVVAVVHVDALVSNVKDDDVAVAPLSSVARTVIACDCGDSVAVPEITPAEESVKPLGNVPDCTAYV
ncbi:unannotated protein [freshwater metagenome]|uniref:Unannotated protein n=1 Tax=freshwater metagenome TaxID=449393 RepID=A0A6J6K9P7_9ZZZZ